MPPRQTASRIPLLWLLLPLILGLVAAHHSSIGSPLICFAAAFLLLGISLVTNVTTQDSHRVWALTYAFACFILGYGIHLQLDAPNQTRTDFPSREATLTLQVKRTFISSTSTSKGIATIVDAPDHLPDFQGLKLYYSLFLDDSSLEPSPSIQISARAVLERITPDPKGNSFNTYLLNQGIWGSFTRGPILSEIRPPNIYHKLTKQARQWIQTRLLRGIDSEAPYAGTYAAMTLGLRNELDTDQKETFLKSGTMHLFAISGLHIGVIAACIHALLQLLRIPRIWLPVLSIILIATFVSITGGSASAWRALLMIACYYLCQSCRVQSAPLNALVLSALICLLIDPRQLFHAGFQMSYATVAVILLYGVPLANRANSAWKPFENLPKVAWSKIHHVISTSTHYAINLFCIGLSTSLVSGFFSIAYFNTLPVAGIITNFLLLPLASLAIIAGVCSIFASLIALSPLSILFNNAAALLLFGIESSLNWLTKWSFTSLQTTAPNTTLLLSLVCSTLVLLTWAYSKNWKSPLRYLWLPAVATNLTCLLIAY